MGERGILCAAGHESSPSAEKQKTETKKDIEEERSIDIYASQH
jgi:hypothetical protein